MVELFLQSSLVPSRACNPQNPETEVMEVSQLVAPLVSSLADGVVERDLHGEVDIIHAQIKATSSTIS